MVQQVVPAEREVVAGSAALTAMVAMVAMEVTVETEALAEIQVSCQSQVSTAKSAVEAVTAETLDRRVSAEAPVLVSEPAESSGQLVFQATVGMAVPVVTAEVLLILVMQVATAVPAVSVAIPLWALQA
jgi:hypothetical protein